MKDPAFLFYPGDYLRDTQCLSEKSQVAYDRLMCEHMRNICISKQQLTFFTKRLTDEEKSELMFLLTEINGGYQITWVADSILKRRNYSDSRRKNRNSKPKNISSTYDSHMENEIENEVEVEFKEEKGITKGKNKRFDFRNALMELGVTENVVSDWLIVRKNKKASNTETAFNFIKKQIELSGSTPTECITIAAKKSWAGFEAQWLNNLQTQQNGTTKQKQLDNISSSGVSDGYKQTILNRLLASGSSEAMSGS